MALEKRQDAKDEIFDLLREQGYPTYARLFDLFDVYLTDDPGVVAYMIPQKAVIVLNRLLSPKQVSTIVRHEILHEYLTHHEREEVFHKENPNYKRNSQISNIAADYEISNKGYTKEDKRIARAIILGDKTLQGLVTEDKYPGWEDMTFEEMYKELLDQQQEDENALEDLLKQIGDFTPQDLDDLLDQLDKIQQSEGQEGEETPSGSSDGSSSSEDSQEENGQGAGSGEKSEEESKLDKLQKEISDEAEELEKEIEKAKSQLPPSQQKDEAGEGSEHSAFPSEKEQAAMARVAAQAKKIEDAFKDLNMKQKILDQAAAAIHRERQRSATLKDAELKSDPLNQFKLNLRKFVQKEIAVKKVKDYKYFNPLNHRLGNDLIFKGKGKDPAKKIPQINVYWDVSWSFSDPAKTAAARSAINTLHQYEKRGDIKLNVYYHGNNVSANKEEVENTGNNGDNVVKHIQRTNPDNVIVITDGDLDWTHTSHQVPGAVWFLFYGARSNGLIRNLIGKKDNQIYDIEWKNR
ncbi:MAG: hypothetical protein J6R47_05565 [Acholeplasmatales bacterium]|nr:hypothetical protein [Acholeplasmatales bacterium]